MSLADYPFPNERPTLPLAVRWFALFLTPNTHPRRGSVPTFAVVRSELPTALLSAPVSQTGGTAHRLAFGLLDHFLVGTLQAHLGTAAFLPNQYGTPV